MGLVRAAGAALSTMMGDQWREYFYCNALDNDTLMLKGERESDRRVPIRRVRIILFPMVLLLR